MKSCSRKILELFYNADHSGRIIKPDAIGRVGENDEGLVIELSWRVQNSVIVDAKFRAFGNPNAIAITSLVTDKLIGKTVSEALEIGDSILLDELGELRPEYIEVFDVVRLAIENTYANYLKKQERIGLTDEIEEVEIEPVVNVTAEISAEQLQRYIDTSVMGTTIKNGRGRPRKPVDETALVETGEKRGRGRPRKPVDETAVVEIGEKRGRGRPRKPVDETAIVEVGEKRGRGRPRKIVDETEVVETVKRGRGRPRKPVDETAIVEVGEKRGRGRPRKIVDESEVQQSAIKRGRGRPRKEISLINTLEITPVEREDGGIKIETLDTKPIEEEQTNAEKEKFVDKLINNNVIVDEDFDTDYDVFKSNIRNIFSGQTAEAEEQDADENVELADNDETFSTEQLSNTDEADVYGAEQYSSIDSVEIEEKRGRGRPRKPVDETAVVEIGEKRGRGRPRKSIDETAIVDVGEKRGRGRPKKVVDETEITEIGEKRGRGRPRKPVDETAVVEVGEKRGRGRPRLNSVSSLTRSLSASSSVSKFNNTQDIVFASKNVTTTNINVNISKVEEESRREEISPVVKYEVEKPKQEDDEIDVEDFDVKEDIDTTNIKDEAPSGLADLLKALLSDDE